jgi:hypothetical protein
MPRLLSSVVVIVARRAAPKTAQQARELLAAGKQQRSVAGQHRFAPDMNLCISKWLDLPWSSRIEAPALR